jgi:hypothetical protein
VQHEGKLGIVTNDKKPSSADGNIVTMIFDGSVRCF